MPKKALLCVIAGFLNQPLLWYLPKSNFLFGWNRNLRCLKICTLVEADSEPLPRAKMELFVTIVSGSKPCIKVMSQRVTSSPRPAFDYNGIS